MIAGLKDRFIPKVESGAKRHTIRRGERWRVGMRIDLFKNCRQKSMELIFRAPVVRVEIIRIVAFASTLSIRIDAHLLDRSECEALAIADGFDSGREMLRFWLQEHGPGIFDGQIVHWDFNKRTKEKHGNQ